jgi:hypothetical protein
MLNHLLFGFTAVITVSLFIWTWTSVFGRF